jgi:hypothetical protein
MFCMFVFIIFKVIKFYTIYSYNKIYTKYQKHVIDDGNVGLISIFIYIFKIFKNDILYTLFYLLIVDFIVKFSEPISKFGLESYKRKKNKEE